MYSIHFYTLAVNFLTSHTFLLSESNITTVSWGTLKELHILLRGCIQNLSQHFCHNQHFASPSLLVMFSYFESCFFCILCFWLWLFFFLFDSCLCLLNSLLLSTSLSLWFSFPVPLALFLFALASVELFMPRSSSSLIMCVVHCIPIRMTSLTDMRGDGWSK